MQKPRAETYFANTDPECGAMEEARERLTLTRPVLRNAFGLIDDHGAVAMPDAGGTTARARYSGRLP